MRYLRETEKGNGTNYTGKVNALMLILHRFRVLAAFLLRFRSAKKGEEKEKEEKRKKRAYFRTRSIHIRISLLTLLHFWLESPFKTLINTRIKVSDKHNYIRTAPFSWVKRGRIHNIRKKLMHAKQGKRGGGKNGRGISSCANDVKIFHRVRRLTRWNFA